MKARIAGLGRWAGLDKATVRFPVYREWRPVPSEPRPYGYVTRINHRTGTITISTSPPDPLNPLERLLLWAWESLQREHFINDAEEAIGKAESRMLRRLERKYWGR